MASIQSASRPRLTILGFIRPFCLPGRSSSVDIRLPLVRNKVRYKSEMKLLRVKRRSGLTTVGASNTSSPSDRDSIIKRKSDAIETGDAAAKGPPFLTILAGFLVFFLLCWMLGSIVMWLISLVAHGPPSPSK